MHDIFGLIHRIEHATGRRVSWSSEYTGHGKHFGGWGRQIVFFDDATPELIADTQTERQLGSALSTYVKEAA